MTQDDIMAATNDCIEKPIPPVDSEVEIPLHKVPHFKYKAIKTAIFCYSIAMVGIAISLLGPTLPQLGRNVNEKNLGWVFTTRGLGYIVSSVITGKIIDHYNEKEKDPKKQLLVSKLILIAGVLCAAGALVIIPFIPYLWLLCIVIIFIGIGGGLLDLGCNVMLFNLWGDRVNTPLQFLHFSWGFGAFLAPLIVYACEAITTSIIGPGPEIGIDPRTQLIVYDRVIHTRVAHIFTALLTSTTIPLVLFGLRSKEVEAAVVDKVELTEVAVAVPEGEQDAATVKVEQESTAEQIKETRRLKIKQILVTGVIGLALFFYVGAEVGFGSLIYSYLTEWQGLTSESHANLLNSAFWLSFSLSRLAGAPISIYLSPKWMLILDLVGCMLSFLVMMIFNTNIVVLWIFSILLGISLATQFPTTMSMPTTSLGMENTGAMTSAMVVLAIAGEMIVPLFLSYLTEHAGPKAMFYSLFGIGACASVLYIILIFGFKKEKKPVAKEEK
ncbi:12 TM domain-containing transmembrane protein Naglt1a [Acrasis kona]|uniref:12 TM domain-containing transmembrane protein Naglt1a n=1 Tax=Acrasis kona TaxID=1008807 RepID=A0AAW2ZEZ4_9EUKA